MIYLQLFLAFLQVGSFSFGGAYGAIPLIRDITLSRGWLSEEMFAYFIAVSESTPGPIMVNMATYIGNSQAGLPGAVLATAGVVLPSFIIILSIASLLNNFLKNKYIQSVLRGIRPCVIGIVLAMGIYMVVDNILPLVSAHILDWQNLFVTCVLLVLSFGYPKMKGKDFPPILLIVVSAVIGIAVYSF